MHKTDTPVRFGNGGGSVLGTSSGFASDVIKQISEAVRYSPKNIIIRRKHDASARHPKIHAIHYTESTVTASTCPKAVTKMVFLPFRLQILSAAYFAICFLCTIYQNTIACDL